MVGLLGTPLAWSQAAGASSVSSLPPAQLAPPAVNALPQGAQVAAGQVQIQQAVNQLTVQQQSSKAIINWQSFDIGQKATVQFQQPGSDAVALNRVQSGAASQIYGKLVANGQVFLLNANGVLFGSDAQVDVGALVAGAMKITDADFLAGRMNFTEGQGVVTNRGTLSAREAGFIALLAPEVRNEGIIRAQRGTVVLAAGEAITLRNSASGLTVVVDKGALQALVDNRHLVSVDDGTVFMTARAASALQQAVVTNSGRIEAKGALRVGGRIRLSADVVNNSGTVDASAAPGSAGQDKSPERSKGGNIQIAASAFTNTGSIRANGDEGGRIEVLANKTLTNDGTIEARGIQGAGGEVVLTSGGHLLQTDSGRVVVTSEGAVQAGGRVVLRAAQLQVQGQVDARSEQGTGGRIDMAALQVSLQDVQLDVSGEQAGGQLQLQGLSTAEPIAASLSSTALVAAASRPGLQEAPNAPVPLPEAPTGPSRTFISGSTLNASSRRGRGGEVTLLGDEIELRSNTVVTATGDTGGGNIFVGGGWQGGGGLPQATRALVDSTVTLDASAITQGDGGTIVVWSDVSKPSGMTTVNGQLTTRGGAQTGNGGRIETSGYDLQVDGIQVSTAAPKGQTGEWLLDPYDITISSGTGSGTTGTYTANADSAVINISALQTALNNSNVRVFTGDSGSQTGNITVAAALTNSTSNSLTLHAAGSIVINADLTSSGTGVLSLLAGSGSIGGTGSLILGSAGNISGATLRIAHGATVSNNIVLNGATTVKLEGVLVDYLVVGGGGGGGGYFGGGGGGGGVLSGSLHLLGTSYSVTVGAGGA